MNQSLQRRRNRDGRTCYNDRLGQHRPSVCGLLPARRRRTLKLVKIGAHVLRHARAITFQLAEVAVEGAMVRCHPCRHPPIASVAVTCMLPKLPECEQKLQDRSVHRAEKSAGPCKQHTISALSRHRMAVRQGQRRAVGPTGLIRPQNQPITILYYKKSKGGTHVQDAQRQGSVRS